MTLSIGWQEEEKPIQDRIAATKGNANNPMAVKQTNFDNIAIWLSILRIWVFNKKAMSIWQSGHGIKLYQKYGSLTLFSSG